MYRRHVTLMVAHVPLLIALLKLVQWKNKPSFVLDIVLLVLPFLLGCTFLSDYLHWTALCLIVTIWVLYQRRALAKTKSVVAAATYTMKSREFISLFKGSNMLVTCTCILAVDFTVRSYVFSRFF